MNISDIRKNIVSFYRKSDKPTFWFATIMLCRLLAFLPTVPSVGVYLCLGGYALYVITRPKVACYKPLLFFLIYIFVQLLIIDPDEMFRSWERFILFSFLIVCVSPFIVCRDSANFRKTIFELLVVVCAFVGVGSFFAKFLGINYGTQGQAELLSAVGTFGGITSHSMLLGPVAGIGAIFCSWCGYRDKNYIYWAMAALCAFSVMFSASRSSLVAAMAGMTVLLYKLSGSKARFLKVVFVMVLSGALSFPLWGGALDSVIQKNELNVAAGGASSSRDALWASRISEFESSPILGVGFDAVDLDIAKDVGGYDENTGMIESGSSWLIILSMTGLIGLVILLPVLVTSYKLVFQGKGELSALICGVLTLFYVHMIAEGYIFYGGSMLAFALWATLGVAHDYQYKEE